MERDDSKGFNFCLNYNDALEQKAFKCICCESKIKTSFESSS